MNTCCLIGFWLVATSAAAAVSIAGHVYTSPQGRPLAGAVVILQAADGGNREFRQTTASDGSYVFADLGAKAYWAAAFHVGFLGQNLARHGGVSPVERGRTDVDFHLRALPQSLEEMPNQALIAAYPNDKYLEAEYGRFSPDGSLFAMATTDGTISSSPDQVWLYNRLTKHLYPVTEKTTAAATVSIDSFVWFGNTLWGERASNQNHGPLFCESGCPARE